MASSDWLDPIDLALEIADILDRIGIPYVLGGSLASSLIGEPRSTDDIDLAVELAIRPGERLVDALGSEFYVDAASVGEAIRNRGSFNVIHLGSMIKVVIFVLGDSFLDRRQIERRRSVVISKDPPAELWVGSTEDQLLRKLAWFQAGGGVSDRQWRDVVGILSVQRDRLDMEDLRAASQQVGVAELLERALTEAEER